MGQTLETEAWFCCCYRERDSIRKNRNLGEDIKLAFGIDLGIDSETSDDEQTQLTDTSKRKCSDEETAPNDEVYIARELADRVKSKRHDDNASQSSGFETEPDEESLPGTGRNIDGDSQV